MGEVIQSIDVNATLRTVYDQWTQFEEFPRFMEGVNRVEQLDDRRLRWTVELAGVEREFEAEITEQRPDQRIAWKSTSGIDQAGVVTFHRLGDTDTRVTLQMKFDPEGIVEQVGDKLGFVTGRTKGDLRRFKDFIEGRHQATGAWRGEIEHDRSPTGDESSVTDKMAEADLETAEEWAEKEGVREAGEHIQDRRQRAEGEGYGFRRFGG